MKLDNTAINEIIGTMLLLGITISLFSVVYISVFTLDPVDKTPLANIAASMIETETGDDIILMKHLGGMPVSGNAKIVINTGNIKNEVAVSSLLAEDNDQWTAGSTLRLNQGDITGVFVEVSLIDTDSNAIMMNHQLQNGSRTLRPSVRTLSASDVTLNSAEVHLVYDFKGFSGEVFFEYRQNEASWIETIKQSGISGSGTWQVSLSGLDEATTYEFRGVLSYNHPNSETVCGEIKEFTTLSLEMNTSVDEISPFTLASSETLITASSYGAIDPQDTTLFYRFSSYNSSVPWWNNSWEKRMRINVETGPNTPYQNYSGYTVQFPIDMTIGDFNADGSDLRIVFWNGSNHSELDRLIIDSGSADAAVRFQLQDNISAQSIDQRYFAYYDNPEAVNPPSDKSKVYLWYDDASIDRISEYVQGRVDESSHGGGWQDSLGYDAAGYYTFDTDDNHADSLRPNHVSERDVYIEYEVYQINAYSSDMTSGPLLRYSGSGSGGSESSNHWYEFALADSSFQGGKYPYHDDILEDDRKNNKVVVENGELGEFPANTWQTIGLAAWGVNPTNLKTFYNNQSGGWNGYRFAGIDDSDDNEQPGQCGVWLQQDAGRLRNILIRRYVEPEPILTLESVEQTEFEPWISVGNDTGGSMQWTFSFVNGSGFYEFYSVGWNNLIIASPEKAPETADTRCEYNGG